MARKYLIFYLCLGFALAVIACSDSGDSARRDNAGAEVAEPHDSVVIVLQGQDGKSVFEITAEHHAVDYINSTEGVFVSAINSLEVGSKFGWMYSVNDSMGRVSSSRYITSDSDIIKWHYRKF